MKVGILVFPGSNCDHDCYHAVKEVMGADVSFVWHKKKTLDSYDFIIAPGGFSYGDYLRAGAIAKFSPVMKALADFINKGGPALGICNGFQILTEAKLLPGALMHNESMKFVCKNTWLKVETKNSFITKNVGNETPIKIPVAHMEGRYTCDEDTLDRLEREDRILFRYCDQTGEVTGVANPNGSARNIAGVLSENRKVAGMMPHPERVCENILGGEDGKQIFQSVIAHLDL